jgi:hypothetical protein
VCRAQRRGGFGKVLESHGEQPTASSEEPLPIEFADALTPFANAERERLLRYLARLDRLLRARFFQTEAKITVKFDRERGWGYDAPWEQDEEAIDAMLPRLRILYERGRPTSVTYPRTVALLRAHVTATAEGARLTASLNDYDETHKQILEDETGGLSMVTNDEEGNVTDRRPIPAGEAFLDWLYGEHLHDDEVRLARIEPWRDFGMHRYLALDTARKLTLLYHHFGHHVVRPVVDEPGLLSPQGA